MHPSTILIPQKPKVRNPVDRSVIEVQLDRKKIKCRICLVSEPINLPFEYQSDKRNETSRELLRIAVNNFKKKHAHTNGK